MKVYTPPNQIFINGHMSVFLAGTIDMGESEDWQQKVIDVLKDTDLNIYNPRRPDWDSSWENKFESPQFFQQVSWEMDAMDKADYIIMNFLPGSKSPISLLELGLYAQSEKLMVCCPPEFYRSGNVQVLCNKFRITMYESMEALILEMQASHLKQT